jgi:hypothetical protein
VIDSQEPHRFEEAAQVLKDALQHEDLASLDLLVFANKADAGPVSTDEVQNEPCSHFKVCDNYILDC